MIGDVDISKIRIGDKVHYQPAHYEKTSGKMVSLKKFLIKITK